MLIAMVGRGDLALRLELRLLDRSVDSLLGLVDDARSPEVRAFLNAIKEDQGAVLQTSPEAMDLMLAGFGHARAAGLTGGVSLRRPVSARVVGLAETFAAAAGGASSLGTNPAGLTGAERPELTSTFTSGVVDDAFGFLGYAHPTRLGVAAAALAYYDAGKVELSFPGGVKETRTAQRDMIFQTGWAKALGAGLSAGILAKFYRFELAQEAHASGLAADAGLQWAVPLPGLRIGGSISNLGQAVRFESESDPLPLTARLGAAWTLRSADTRLTLLVDGVKVRDEAAYPSAGGEFCLAFGPTTELALRGGWIFNHASDGAAFGLGVREGRFTLDYALAAKGILGNVHHVSLAVRF